MRTYKHQFEKVIEYGNLAKAINRSSLRKRDRDDVYDVFLNPDKHIKKIIKQLLEQTWKPRKHRAEVINDGITQKKRLIIRPDFCYEQVIHHAVIQVMQPIFYKGMYEYSCGSIPDRGATLGQKYIEKYIRKNNISNPPKNCKWNKSNIKYVLKLDIHHFFQSINIDILKQKFANKIKDERMLWLLNTILQSNIVSFEGQDVDIGLPIGYYTSQWFANWYLQDLDHFIKENLHIRCYVRYMDDMIMFGKNKKELKRCLEKIREFLKTLDLDIKDNWQIFRFDYIDKNGKRKGRPLDFIGFKFCRDKTILRKPIMYKATRKASKLEKKEKLTWYDACQVLSYMGYFKHSDTWLIREKYIAKKISIKACKSVISKHSKLLNLQKKQNSDKIKEKGEQNGDNIQKSRKD